MVSPATQESSTSFDRHREAESKAHQDAATLQRAGIIGPRMNDYRLLAVQDVGFRHPEVANATRRRAFYIFTDI